MHSNFEQFIQERKYLKGVSARTIEWYQESFKWLDNENPTEFDLKSCVVRMRQKGLKPVSCNNRIRVINAYLHWKADGHSKCSAACKHLKRSKLKEEQRVLPTFTPDDIQKFLH